uniref:Uncharacterized protein n=1 Tax=Panagrolaimus sp. JU765 TaxID=591449 RepID=A0AC34R852_9BILA
MSQVRSTVQLIDEEISELEATKSKLTWRKNNKKSAASLYNYVKKNKNVLTFVKSLSAAIFCGREFGVENSPCPLSMP